MTQVTQQKLYASSLPFMLINRVAVHLMPMYRSLRLITINQLYRPLIALNDHPTTRVSHHPTEHKVA